MQKTYITEISETDFRKLDLEAYERRKVKVDGETSRLEWVKVKMNDIIDKEDEIARENKWAEWKSIVIGLHEEPGEGEDIGESGAYYYDKWLTRQGQTYIFGGFDEEDIRLYSVRGYWENNSEGYFRVPKSGTRAVYIIRRGV